jgi:hypothetical protein
MDEIQAHTDDHLRRVLQTALGSAQRIASLTRLHGGTKKGVYRAVLDDRSVIVYVWDTSENYWPAGDPDLANDESDPFADASGADLFAVSNQYLQSLGVRTPELYHLDTSRAASPADIAIVEDIQGGTLQEHWQRQPDDAARITAELERCSGRSKLAVTRASASLSLSTTRRPRTCAASNSHCDEHSVISTTRQDTSAGSETRRRGLKRPFDLWLLTFRRAWSMA